MRRVIILLLPLLCLTSGLRASEEDDRSRWQSLNDRMSEHEYKEACKDNQRIVRKFIKSRSMTMMDSVGIPETGSRLLGAAAGMAANLVTNKDMKLNLNESRTMALEFRDPAGNDNSLMLRFKLDW
jgi:hypothetical protein